jgi:hypothetical protein
MLTNGRVADKDGPRTTVRAPARRKGQFSQSARRAPCRIPVGHRRTEFAGERAEG